MQAAPTLPNFQFLRADCSELSPKADAQQKAEAKAGCWATFGNSGHGSRPKRRKRVPRAVRAQGGQGCSSASELRAKSQSSKQPNRWKWGGGDLLREPSCHLPHVPRSHRMQLGCRGCCRRTSPRRWSPGSGWPCHSCQWWHRARLRTGSSCK